MEVLNTELLKEIIEDQKKLRPYAGYFNCPDKQVKELMVVSDLLQAIREREGRNLVKRKSLEPGPGVNLPPDVIGITQENARVAFEVTELVDSENIDIAIETRRRFQQLKSDRKKEGRCLKWEDWPPEEIIKRLESKLTDKGRTDFGKGQFASVVLVIHTDELQVSIDQCELAISTHQFLRRGQIDEAYLLFRPRPMDELGLCRYLRLHLSKNPLVPT